MAIIRWNPWNVDRFLEDEWDLPTIPGLSRLAGQGLNIYETETEIVAQTALPGIPEENIDITIDSEVVRINGQNQTNQEDKEKKRYYMSSMSQSYNYTFRLPKNINPDQEPNCELKDGVLTMRFQKIEKQTPKKIKINKTQNQNI